ncbi:hypothetical protein O984_23965 [Mycobacterium avium 05-4293]|nr:hypothetical protein O984_23965 [Mycobacterium avium 05-4293]
MQCERRASLLVGGPEETQGISQERKGVAEQGQPAESSYVGGRRHHKTDTISFMFMQG